MNSDIAFFFNGSSIHTPGADPNNFSIFPISDSYSACVYFKNIALKAMHTFSDEYEIFPHPTLECGDGLFDMVTFICVK